MNIFIGTCGYGYQHWGQGIFYPSEVKQNQWLTFYSQYFNSVELNVTFYRLPEKRHTQLWNEHTPKDFVFSVKGSRFITHIKRLKDVEDPLIKFRDSLLPLESKIKCFLWQFPPHFKRDEERLEKFSQQLKKIDFLKSAYHAFEFREESWFHPNTYSILKNFKFCLCFFDPLSRNNEEIITSDFIYIRFHGGASDDLNYSDKELKKWIKKIEAWKDKLTAIFAFFNNDACGYAVSNASSFSESLLAK